MAREDLASNSAYWYGMDTAFELPRQALLGGARMAINATPILGTALEQKQNKDMQALERHAEVVGRIKAFNSVWRECIGKTQESLPVDQPAEPAAREIPQPTYDLESYVGSPVLSENELVPV